MPFPIENIKKLCDERGTDFKNLEDALGFSNSTIARWKNAKKLPPYDKVKAVASFFGVSVSQLSNGAYPDLQSDGFDPLLNKKTPVTESNGIQVLSDMENFLIDRFRKLNFEDQLDVVNDLRVRTHNQSTQDGQTESE